jgi:hypothetical protein
MLSLAQMSDTLSSSEKTGLTIQVAAQPAYLQRVSKICMSLYITKILITTLSILDRTNCMCRLWMFTRRM